LKKNPIIVPGSEYVQNSPKPIIAANPQVVLLVDYLSKQPHVQRDDLEKNEMEAWNELSVIVVEQLLPLQECVAQNWSHLRVPERK
jgi:hypothetical protein